MKAFGVVARQQGNAILNHSHVTDREDKAVHVRQIDHLYALTNEVVDSPNDRSTFDQWITAIRESDTDILVELTGRLTSDAEHRPAGVKAAREAIISEIERKNTDHVVSTMKQLDKAAGRLTVASFVLAVIGTLVAVLQFWQQIQPQVAGQKAKPAQVAAPK